MVSRVMVCFYYACSLCYTIHVFCVRSIVFVFVLIIRRPPRATLLTHSLPTRRSSDLFMAGSSCCMQLKTPPRLISMTRCHSSISQSAVSDRSEEHTSELQSLMRISYAVFCVKKKNNLGNEPMMLAAVTA